MLLLVLPVKWMSAASRLSPFTSFLNILIIHAEIADNRTMGIWLLHGVFPSPSVLPLSSTNQSVALSPKVNVT